MPLVWSDGSVNVVFVDEKRDIKKVRNQWKIVIREKHPDDGSKVNHDRKRITSALFARPVD